MVSAATTDTQAWELLLWITDIERVCEDGDRFTSFVRFMNVISKF